MIKLLLTNKNLAVVGEYDIKTPHVPRVGEIINMCWHPEFKGIADHKFFVLDIEHTYKGGTLVPEVTCRQWFEKTNCRKEYLEEFGWL